MSRIIVPKAALARLDEFNYRDIMQAVDWDFINMRKHYDDTRRRGIQYIPYDPGNPENTSHVGELDGRNVFYSFWKTPLSPRSKRRYPGVDAWYQTIAALDYDTAMEPGGGYTMRDRAHMMMITGDIALHCTCPAFTYWGYNFIVTSLDSEVHPENRPPDERNPRRRGIVCKHLRLALSVIGAWLSDFSRDIKNQVGEVPRELEEPETEEQ